MNKEINDLAQIVRMFFTRRVLHRMEYIFHLIYVPVSEYDRSSDT